MIDDGRLSAAAASASSSFERSAGERIVDRYYSRDGSVRALMDEFEISGKPGSFVSILPPIIHDDVNCPYCVGQSLVSGRQSRDTTQSPIPFCHVCGHQDDARCACKTCKATAFEKAKQIAEQKRDVIRGRFAFPSSPDLDIENLSFRNAIFLLAAFRYSVSEDLSEIAPLCIKARTACSYR